MKRTRIILSVFTAIIVLAASLTPLLAPQNVNAASGRIIRLIGGVRLIGGIRLGGNSPLSNPASAYTGPGDVVPGATAWWGLRAYSSATSGSKAANICRASDSTCEDINTLSDGNFDTATAASFCASTTCTIHTLYDQTGNGYDLTQSVVVFRPMLTLNCLGSLPCITFMSRDTGTSTSLGIAGGPTQAQPITGEFVANQAASPAELFDVLDSAGGNTQFGFRHANTIGAYAGNAVQTLSASDGSWHASQSVFNGAASVLYVDATASSAYNAGTSSLTGFADFTINTIGFDGKIVEGGWWPSAFNSTQASNMNSNAHTYWGF